jgi:hypothetical protein
MHESDPERSVETDDPGDDHSVSSVASGEKSFVFIRAIRGHVFPYLP